MRLSTRLRLSKHLTVSVEVGSIVSHVTHRSIVLFIDPSAHTLGEIVRAAASENLPQPTHLFMYVLLLPSNQETRSSRGVHILFPNTPHPSNV